jgi:serine/threonine-protein kinase
VSPDFREDDTPSLWLRAEQILAARNHMPREEWEAYRDRECAGNPRLRELVDGGVARINADATDPYPAAPPEHATAAVAVCLPAPGQFPAIPGYEILEELGCGGMGVVYRARHLKLNRLVALKMILGGEQAGRGDLTRFLAEAKAVAAIKDKNVVQVFDYGEADGLPFMALEYLSGGPISSLLRADGESARRPLAPRDAARLVSQIARGVAATHALGIIHRDLKPGNVLFDEAGTPKVADFGLALRMEGARGVTQSGQIHGTPEYMAPEQASGEPILTTAVDVYGLGATLYALLTGRPPFKGATTEETLGQVRDPELTPEPPRESNPRVDPDLDAVCRKCLDKNPECRHPSAAALADDLDLWLAGRETSALGWDWPYWLWRLLRRNGALAAAVGAAVVFVAVWDIHNSYSRLAERERQVLTSNAYTARSVARTVEERLQLWSSAVMRESQSEALRTHLRRKDQAELQKLVERAHSFHASPESGFTREGAVSPFASWFVMEDKTGRLLAHAGANAKVEGAFPWRDYFQGASARKDGVAYVSRVYHTHLAGQV